jgi:putative endonuclease
MKTNRLDDKQWVVYLVRCADESLYCGMTNNIERRLVAHNSGKGAKYTQSRIPVEVVAVSSKMSRSEALKLECQIKKTPAAKKINELKGEFSGSSKTLE